MDNLKLTLIKISKYLIAFLFLVFTQTLNAQYKFEFSKKINYKSKYQWITKVLSDNEREFSINNITLNGNLYSIKVSKDDSLGISKIFINCNNKNVLETDFSPIYTSTEFSDVLVADFNNDNLLDLKLVNYYYGSGGYNYATNVYYLLQIASNKFKIISYFDDFEGFKNRVEVDFDNDGKFEIITQTFYNYQKHNYWRFDVFQIKDYKLVNMNKKFAYPFFVQLLYYQNYKASTKIPLKENFKFYKFYPNELHYF